MKQIYSPGKLLLTSEYVVLDGALALAVPTNLGQEFFFEELQDGKSIIYWEALHQNVPWLKAKINYKTWEIEETNLDNAANFILKVFKNIQKNSNKKFEENNSYSLKTNLQFPPDFGLGSSSTLLNNLAEWAKIDPYLLNQQCLGGSGYDIAVAQEKSAILYQNYGNYRKIETISYNPAFKKDLILIHLNQKQDSRKGIELYQSKNKSEELIAEFSDLTKAVFEAKNIETFSQLMEIHEDKIANFLQLQPVKDKYFKDYGGFVKSLGAWGGDFVLASKFGDYKSYFFSKGYNVIFEYEDLII